MLELARTELECGRLSGARTLIRGVQARAPALRPLTIALQARLELAQGRAADALSLLRGAHGEDLSGAPADVLLVAAHASEQSGRRNEARLLFRRAMGAAASRTEQLRALTGLGYGLFLDGAWEAALDITAAEPREDDPDEPAAALLNLRGVALTRLRRNEEAQAALDAARSRARAASDALSLARTELNLAHLDRRRGALADAAAGLQRALRAFGEAGHVQGRALALNNLGVLQRDLGDLRHARALLEESLALRRRVGDAHGAASSLGSLALVELEAGHIGAALSLLERARELFARGAHESELAMLDQALAMSLALAGRHLEATSLLDGPRAGTARREFAALGARADALVHFVAGQRDLALAAAERACREATDTGDLAESFRAGSLVAALSRDDPAVALMLRETAERIGSPVRRAEAALRTLSPHEQPSAELLESWSTIFEQAGRTDLVATVSTLLADVLDRAGDASGRRRVQARAADAADALTDGLPAPERERTLVRLGRLVGSGPAADAPRRLTVDWFLACNRRLAAEQDLEGLLRTIMDMALDVTGARRGFLVLLDGEAVTVQVARGIDESGLGPDEAQFSRTVVREAVVSRAPVLTTDAASDRRFSGTESVGSLRLRSVVCVPLTGSEEPSGALYLDNDQREAAFDSTDVQRLSSLADQASV
ncbi:MAG TPA: GAF domain-containing protein, partial [Planctomycetota bacterium]|nr:GAF domain-containing protein [Planctomycetota bacterium]